jgi:hypothetical protein
MTNGDRPSFTWKQPGLSLHSENAGPTANMETATALWLPHTDAPRAADRRGVDQGSRVRLRI